MLPGAVRSLAGGLSAALVALAKCGRFRLDFAGEARMHGAAAAATK